MATKVNGMNVFHTQTLFIPEKSDAWIDFDNGEDDVKAHIVLVDDTEEPDVKAYRMSGQDDHVRLELKNWNSSSGTCFQEREIFGENPKGEQIALVAFGQKFGKMLRLEVQFYLLEAESNE
ncbi:hypothetical protein NDJ15_16145 [Vibrio parahaemolyticus]|uniref:hypothetical protein n=1 Tax=Vibrio parahaemolyticus TaxID=670 RepID=UPI0021608744|nr:hypothetical protein [Vibrio parahaemolyticus]EHD2267443.1 hypothetical protein [Vibrio cholerae]EHY8868589.1 hypothetical protein [Vibrio parahaemolyticus]EII3132201.1 hypothetical protein [Vibrio parahaemolyticus]EJG1508114.1 hypothetical protein [Vibrio parahaemolyticus]MCS0070012.1 hypothetical protein [Vibrio parahaemolyticus]